MNCTICNNLYCDPKLLPCFHCYCHDCIEILRVRDREGFHCPECHVDVHIPENNVDNFPDAIPVRHKMQLLRLKQKLDSEEVSCEACNEIGAEAFCTSCAKLVCKQCAHKHQTELEYSDHEVTSIQEGQDDSKYHDVIKMARVASQRRSVEYCSEHRGEELSRYCYNCSMFICSICASAKHKRHKHDIFEKSNEKCQELLQKQLPNMRLLHKRIAGAILEVQKKRAEVESQGKSLASFVDSEFERISTVLERHKTQLKKRLNQRVADKIERLSQQQVELASGAAELQRLEDFTTDSLETTTEKELLLLYKFTNERLSEATHRCSHMGVDPVEVPNLSVKASSSGTFSDMFRKHVNLYSKDADPSKCTAKGQGLKSAEMLATSQFSLHICDGGNKPCDSIQYVSVTVKCLSNDIRLSADVSNEGMGDYRVSYCPKYRGMHEITVQVNDNHVSGSPFSIRVCQHPSHLGKSQTVIDGIKGPRGITLNRQGNLLVSEWNGGKIVELNKFGQKVRSFGEHLSHPAGIVADKVGNVYVTDAAGERCRIAKFDPDGNLLKEVGREGASVGEFKNPRGLAMTKQSELFVCDRDNSRIQVFYKNLEFIRCIDVQGAVESQQTQPCKPTDLTFDRDGNMYITDTGNNCIHCMTTGGQYLMSFSSDGVEAGKLTGPEGIHYKNGYLYVTDCNSHRISVFRSNGDFVSQFGTLGSGYNELKFPMGIVTDENGFVYVCELFNDRIQVF